MSTYNSDNMYKMKGYDDDDNFHYDYSTMEGVPLILGECNSTNRSSSRQYPGNRRIPISNQNIPNGNILVQTAGNALQAIPQPQQQLIEVQVPVGTNPGDTIHVRSPYNPDDIIAATIPENLSSGQIFYVQCPTMTISSPPVVAIPTESSEESTTVHAVMVHNQNDLHLYDNNNLNESTTPSSSTATYRG